MDKDLQRLLRLYPLQKNVITYRENTNLYRIMKVACAAELTNLVNVEIDIEQTALKRPDPKKVPPLPANTIEHQKPKPHEEVDVMLLRYRNTKDAFNLL